MIGIYVHNQEDLFSILHDSQGVQLRIYQEGSSTFYHNNKPMVIISKQDKIDMLLCDNKVHNYGYHKVMVQSTL